MNWYTFCGYDGNENIVIHVQGNSVEQAYEKAKKYLALSPDFVFEGKLKELTEELTVHEIP